MATIPVARTVAQPVTPFSSKPQRARLYKETQPDPIVYMFCKKEANYCLEIRTQVDKFCKRNRFVPRFDWGDTYERGNLYLGVERNGAFIDKLWIYYFPLDEKVKQPALIWTARESFHPCCTNSKPGQAYTWGEDCCFWYTRPNQTAPRKELEEIVEGMEKLAPSKPSVQQEEMARVETTAVAVEVVKI